MCIKINCLLGLYVSKLKNRSSNHRKNQRTLWIVHSTVSRRIAEAFRSKFNSRSLQMYTRIRSERLQTYTIGTNSRISSVRNSGWIEVSNSTECATLGVRGHTQVVQNLCRYNTISAQNNKRQYSVCGCVGQNSLDF